MLRIITSRDPLQGLDHCLSELADFSRKEQDNRAFFLVPEAAKADTERRYMEMFDRRGLMMAEVLSFKRLAYRLLTEAGVFSRDRLGKNAKSLLVSRLLQAHKEDYPFLGRMAHKVDYGLEIVSVLGEFDRYEISPEVLEEASQAPLADLSRQKIRDLARLQADLIAYKQELELTDSDEDLSRLLQLLEELEDHPRLDFLANSRIWICAFGLSRAFTAEETSLILALARHTAEVNLSLCLAGSEATTEEVRASRFALSSLEALRMRSRGTSPVAWQIEALDPPAEPGKHEIELWRSLDSREELAAAAGEIKYLLKLKDEHGRPRYRRRDIGVAVCDSNDLDRLSRSFREYSLDPFIASARPLAESPLLRYLSFFLSLTEAYGQPAQLIALARTGLLEIDPLELDAWENCVLAGPARYLADLDRPYAYGKQRRAAWALSFYQDKLASTLEAAKALSGLETAASKARFLAAWLDTGRLLHGTEHSPSKSVRQLLEEAIAKLRLKEPERALLLANSWEAVISLLEEIALYLADDKLSDAEFKQLLLVPLLSQSPQGIPLGLDRVRVGTADQLLLYPAKVLFILGAKNDSFPPQAPNEGLLQNQEREVIAKAIGRTFPSHRRDAVQAGQSLVYFLMQRGSDKLYLSCPSLDEEFLSPTQQRLAAEGRYSERVFSRHDLPDVRWLSPQRASREWQAMGDSAFKSSSIGQMWSEALAGGPEAAPEDPLDKPVPLILLPRDLAAAELDRMRSISASRLETYNECPYQYFLSYSLGLKEREVFQPQAPDRGSFLHAMLEQAMQDLMRLTSAAADAAGRKAALEAWKAGLNPTYVAKIYNEISREAAFVHYREPRIRGAYGSYLSLALAELLQFNSAQFEQNQFLPAALEWRFPERDSRAITGLQVGGRQIPLGGIIDRWDEDPEGLVKLVDYKSSEIAIPDRDLLLGKNLQLPLYAKAWQDAHPEKKLVSLALQGIYLPDQQVEAANRLKETSFKMENALEEAQLPLEVLSDYALTYSQKLLRAMERGVFSPRPLTNKTRATDGAACKYCSYRAICRFDERLLAERVRHVDLGIREDARSRKALKEYLDIYRETGLLAADYSERQKIEKG